MRSVRKWGRLALHKSLWLANFDGFFINLLWLKIHTFSWNHLIVSNSTYSRASSASSTWFWRLYKSLFSTNIDYNWLVLVEICFSSAISYVLFSVNEALFMFWNWYNKWRHLTAKSCTRNVLTKKAKKEAFAAGVRPVWRLDLIELNEDFHLAYVFWPIWTDLKSYLRLNFTNKFTNKPFWPLDFGCKICTQKGHKSKN